MLSKYLFLLAALIPLLALAQAANLSSNPRGDGTIRLYNYHLDEFAEVQFRKGDKIIPEGTHRIHHLLRSRDKGESKVIQIELIDLIDHLQDHFKADTIEIISAYRSPQLNAELKAQGHKVSPVSLHMEGQALDIHIDEVREEALRDYLLSLKRGGVGYYGSFDFVHVDSGPTRRWGESGKPARKLIGVLCPQAPIQLISDQNDYLPGRVLKFRWQVDDQKKLAQIDKLQLEHFHRGRWQTVSGALPAVAAPGISLASSAPLFNDATGQIRAGRYRWLYHIKEQPAPCSSNEFYLKTE